MASKQRLLTFAALAISVFGTAESKAATLMSFTQVSPTTQYVRWNDTGTSTSG